MDTLASMKASAPTSTAVDSKTTFGASDPRARYIMIGGFLGAGKTTAVGRLARWLCDRGMRVGLITNDQGSHLVDTNLLLKRGFPVEEIPGGCFCCRFNSLVDATKRLTAASRPEVFVAEPVGSCTDLAATVTYPLRQLYGEGYSIAPLSVLVDGYLGVTDVCLSLPVVVGKKGIERFLHPDLNAMEAGQFRDAAKAVRAVIEGLK